MIKEKRFQKVLKTTLSLITLCANQSLGSPPAVLRYLDTFSSYHVIQFRVCLFFYKMLTVNVEDTGLKWTMLWKKQRLCNPAPANKDRHEDASKQYWISLFLLRSKTEIMPQRHDWRMNVWLRVFCSRSCSNPIRMTKCSQIGMTLKFVPDVTQGISTEAHHQSVGMPRSSFLDLIGP